jgi:N-acetylmuramoyl-L-alanine amidase
MTGLGVKPIEMASPNYDDRKGVAVDMLILHYTGMLSGRAALARLCDPAAKVSAHYAIDEDGTIYALVPEARRAWHAGISYWAGAVDINARSIGIELINPGHDNGYRCFPEAQIGAAMALCHGLLLRHPISSSRVLAHSDVAPSRKKDPGELFPWSRLALAGIGLWPDAKYGDQPAPLSADALPRFGYDPRVPQQKVILAFQRHFRPRKLDGLWDGECAAILSALLGTLGPAKSTA